MQQLGDDLMNEKLIAFLDGEINDDAAAELEALLAEDAGLSEHLARLGEATALARQAFDTVLDEPVPAHLLALAQGRPAAAEPVEAKPAGAAILPFRRKPKSAATPADISKRRWWLGMAAAASLSGLVVGSSVDFFAGGTGPAPAAPGDGGAGSATWLDNVAGYHNLFISPANGAENTVFDVAPGAEKKELPSDIQVPDLKPWGMTFEGARRIVLDGRPAFQFFYRPAPVSTAVATGAAGKQVAGPITIVVTDTSRPEQAPHFERRDQVNMTYWRHLGHGYAIVGQADRGWMFSVANDVAYQTSAH